MIIRILVSLHFFRYSLHIHISNKQQNKKPRNSYIGKKKYLLICLNEEDPFWGVIHIHHIQKSYSSLVLKLHSRKYSLSSYVRNIKHSIQKLEDKNISANSLTRYCLNIICLNILSSLNISFVFSDKDSKFQCLQGLSIE